MENYLTNFSPEELAERKDEEFAKIRERVEEKWLKQVSYMEMKKEKIWEQNKIWKRQQRSKEKHVEMDLGLRDSNGNPIQTQKVSVEPS